MDDLVLSVFALLPHLLKLKMDETDSSQSGNEYESPLPTHNPSPPPELRDNEAAMADIVKGTLVSKEWIFSIFLQLMEVIRPIENLFLEIKIMIIMQILDKI